MNNWRSHKRTLICTFIALASGLFGGYTGGQINALARSQQCQNQPLELENICRMWVAPGAVWQGSTTGFWVGTILGAFAGGLATRKGRSKEAIGE